MTMLVHLIDTKAAASVRRSGLRGHPASITTAADRVEIPQAVYAMPMLPNFYASHQWLRELKRRGMRTISAVHFRMRADALVWVGRYNGEHRRVPLGHATGLIMHEVDARGWQIVIPHDVPAKAIHAIRDAPQVVGWRYFPESHEKGPWKCMCEYCLASFRGGIKGRRLRERLFDELGCENLNFEGDVKRLLRKKRGPATAGR